jgi:hypothetical protein
VRLSHITANRSTVHVPIGDEKLQVDYRPAVFTPAMEDQLRDLQAGEGGRVGRRFCELLCQVVSGWDLEEDDGAPVPATPDRMVSLPSQFLSKVLQAIAEDMTAGEAPAGSGAGSAPTGSSVSNPTGIASSPPPATSTSPPGTSPPSP